MLRAEAQFKDEIEVGSLARAKTRFTMRCSYHQLNPMLLMTVWRRGRTSKHHHPELVTRSARKGAQRTLEAALPRRG